MKIIAIFKNSKGFNSLIAENYGDLCSKLNTYGVENVSIAILPEEKDPLDESLPLSELLPPKSRELKVGTWYKNGDIHAFYKGEGIKSHGMGPKGFYITSFFDWKLQSWELLEDLEVRDLLMAEANRLFKGKIVKISEDGEYLPYDEISKVVYSPTRDALCAFWHNKQKYSDIYCDGGWAISKEPVEKATLFGIKNYSEDELLDLVHQISQELGKRKRSGK